MTRWEVAGVTSVITKRFAALWDPGPAVKYQATTPAAMITMMSTKVFVSKLER
jgi:hypothetical protein